MRKVVRYATIASVYYHYFVKSPIKFKWVYHIPHHHVGIIIELPFMTASEEKSWGLYCISFQIFLSIDRRCLLAQQQLRQEAH